MNYSCSHPHFFLRIWERSVACVVTKVRLCYTDYEQGQEICSLDCPYLILGPTSLLFDAWRGPSPSSKTAGTWSWPHTFNYGYNDWCFTLLPSFSWCDYWGYVLKWATTISELLLAFVSKLSFHFDVHNYVEMKSEDNFQQSWIKPLTLSILIRRFNVVPLFWLNNIPTCIRIRCFWALA